MAIFRSGWLWCFMTVLGLLAVGRWHQQANNRQTLPESNGAILDNDNSALIELISLRIRAKERLVEDLVAGRRSLLHTAALFRELDRIPPAVNRHPDALIDPVFQPANPSVDEWQCVLVITYARNMLRISNPDRTASVIDRLMRELEAERRDRGIVRLPDPRSLEPVQVLLERSREGLEPGRRKTLPRP